MARYSETAFAALTEREQRLVREDIADVAEELSADLDDAESTHYTRVGGDRNLKSYAACLVAGEDRRNR